MPALPDYDILCPTECLLFPSTLGRISFGSGAPIENSFGETALEVGAGVTARLNQTAGFCAHAGYRWSRDGGRARESTTQGTIGIRLTWW